MKFITFVIDDQMQLKTEEPPHRAFASFRYAFESLVDEYALVLAIPQRS